MRSGKTSTLALTRRACVEVYGTESDLRSALQNLVDNALRYAPQGSAVTVSARRVEQMIELRVVDAGRGIPAAERDRVFRRFHRVAGDPTQGTGLGLAIVKAIVERHQGRIELADAQLDGEAPGLAVSILLPAWAGRAKIPEVPAAIAQARRA